MNDISKQRYIDGDKLLKWIEEQMLAGIFENDNLNTIRGNVFSGIHEHIKSGRFDLLSDQGESTRMREALEKFADGKNWTVSTYKSDVIMEWNETRYGDPQKIAREALSSLTEERKIPTDEDSIARYIGDVLINAGGFRAVNWEMVDMDEGIIDGLHAGRITITFDFPALIPGITEER
ncbi:hypothetical protein [Cohnella cholangitidis]|uniref:Uncharacterized protein n=1 Tax=Cohnella cholangitidis TaxID=2598458 RepID=A0A7G5C3E1_9BACL|nr:hypothetical protein [Cohnella cholangitidis]QMV43725.1 hypothetical protein FPL14_23040 [Cohnella cholangitidis]